MKELIKLLEMEEQQEVLIYAAECLRAEGKHGTLHVTDEYVYFDTGHPICLMAHVDTVTIRGCKVGVQNYILTNTVIGQPLGADDRAGVFAALKAFRALAEQDKPRPSMLFTTDEECGGLGARKFVEDDIFNKTDTFLVLALDRKGAAEYVHYVSQPREVEQYIESFGFTKGHGSYNDVLDLNSAYKVPGVNLSVGYYSQHTASERLHVDELMMTVQRLLRMCSAPIDKLYPLVNPYNWRSNRGKGGWRNQGNFQQGFGFAGGDDDYGWSDYSKQKKKEEKKKNKKKQELKSGSKSSLIYDKIDSFFDDYCSKGHYCRHVCPQCRVVWMSCRCGEMLKLFKEHLTLEERELVSEMWLLDGDNITKEFNEELLADLLADELASRTGGEEEEESNVIELPYTKH